MPLQYFWPLLRCGFVVFFAIALSDFFISLLLRIWGLSGACILIASWLLVFAMSRSLSGCHVDRAHLGGFLRPGLASFASWFSVFPRGMGVCCFTHLFFWFCFTRCCLVVSGYEGLRPANVVLFLLFQAVVSTLINQDGTTLRIALFEGSSIAIFGENFLAPFLGRTTDTIHNVRSLCSLVVSVVVLALAAHGLSCSCRVRLGTRLWRVFFRVSFTVVLLLGFQRHLFFGRSGPTPVTTGGPGFPSLFCCSRVPSCSPSPSQPFLLSRASSQLVSSPLWLPGTSPPSQPLSCSCLPYPPSRSFSGARPIRYVLPSPLVPGPRSLLSWVGFLPYHGSAHGRCSLWLAPQSRIRYLRSLPADSQVAVQRPMHLVLPCHGVFSQQLLVQLSPSC